MKLIWSWVMIIGGLLMTFGFTNVGKGFNSLCLGISAAGSVLILLGAFIGFYAECITNETATAKALEKALASKI